MHDGVSYDPFQAKSQGHVTLKIEFFFMKFNNQARGVDRKSRKGIIFCRSYCYTV